MQFAYKDKTGTATCTWTVTTVVDHFTRKGKPLYGAAMDMSKAFDMVKWSELFSTLLERKINPLFLRLLLYIYIRINSILSSGEKKLLYSSMFLMVFDKAESAPEYSL